MALKGKEDSLKVGSSKLSGLVLFSIRLGRGLRTGTGMNMVFEGLIFLYSCLGGYPKVYFFVFGEC